MKTTTVTLSGINPMKPDERYIVVAQKEFDEDGLATGRTKRGILEISADQDPDERLEFFKGKYKFSLTGEPDNAGMFTVKKVLKVQETVDSQEETIETTN